MLIRILSLLLVLITLACFYSCEQKQQKPKRYRTDLPENNIVEFVERDDMFIDPIDDTINFKRLDDNIYTDSSGKAYIRSMSFRPLRNDTLAYYEYYKDMTAFINLKSYSQIKDGYFRNNGKVYIWGANSDGNYPIEVVGADPESFVPFDSVAGGVDKNHVFYGGFPDDFSIIHGADPATIKVLNPERGCWNCQSCYFVDKYNVFYGLKNIEYADPNTFRLLNQETIDAEDKNGKYFEGNLIK